MTFDIIQAAIEKRRVTIAGARLRRTEIVITPDEAEAVADLLEALDAYEQRGYSPDRYERVRDTTRALAEAITHRSPA